MLNTLLQIGQWQREGISEWDRFLNKPSVVTEDKKGNKIRNFIAEIVFDLDAKDVYLTSDSLKEYDEESDVERYKALKTQGRNSKSIYATVEPAKLVQLFKTFFGKAKDDSVDVGEFTEAIDKSPPHYKESDLYQILQEIFILRPVFKDKYLDGEKANVKEINRELGLEWNNNLVLIYASIKSVALGYNAPTPISSLEDYTSFLKLKLFPPVENKSDGQNKLCYASGEYSEGVAELSLASRYSLNKMFVSTTKNYASQFSKKSFSLNYQISSDNQEKLDLASSFLLNNYKTRIAGIEHVILPQFLSTENIEIDLVLDKLKAKSDLLFSLKTLESLAKDMEFDAKEIFWINFIAFESDGNFFKTLALIKDVSKFHFQHVLEAFDDIKWSMRELDYAVDWDSVTKEYGKISFFNLNSVYGLIPIRKDKEKKNTALLLFKSILEQRKIDRDILFHYFSELMLCHYYERYASYTNVRKYGKEYFGLAVRDCVFKYLAFIQVLTKLKLINMEEDVQGLPAEEIINDFDRKVESFFERMKLNDDQKAMFYLGRMLNAVVYLQKDKNKTVLDKLNYNGMDKDSIVRLRIDLFEKAKQYNQVSKVVFHDGHFGQLFDFKTWSMNPQESLFFILSGYSFGIVKSQDSSTQTENN
jgi:CRISPR-associated protein Csh1